MTWRREFRWPTGKTSSSKFCRRPSDWATSSARRSQLWPTLRGWTSSCGRSATTTGSNLATATWWWSENPKRKPSPVCTPFTLWVSSWQTGEWKPERQRGFCGFPSEKKSPFITSRSGSGLRIWTPSSRRTCDTRLFRLCRTRESSLKSRSSNCSCTNFVILVNESSLHSFYCFFKAQ